jgi:hypothetical protein
MLHHLAVVSDFWPRATGLRGGARLTIAGEGFPTAAAAITVDAGGASCAVMSSSASSIVCELGPYRSDPVSREALPYRGGDTVGLCGGSGSNVLREPHGPLFFSFQASLPSIPHFPLVGLAALSPSGARR